MNGRQLVSLSEFARRQGFQKSYAHRLKLAGRLVLEENLVDVAASERLIEQTANPTFAERTARRLAEKAPAKPRRKAERPVKPAKPAKEAGRKSAPAPLVPLSAFHQARTDREVVSAAQARLEFEERAGRLVDAELVRAKVQAMAAQLREALRQIPGRVAPLLGLEPVAQRQAQQILRQEIDRVLSEAAGGGV